MRLLLLPCLLICLTADDGGVIDGGALQKVAMPWTSETATSCCAFPEAMAVCVEPCTALDTSRETPLQGRRCVPPSFERERGSAIPTILRSVSDQVEPSRRVAPRHFRGCGVPKLDFPKSHNEDFGAGGGSLLQPYGSGRATASLTPAAPPIGSSGAKATLWRQWRSRSGHRPVVSMGRISELVLLQKRL